MLSGPNSGEEPRDKPASSQLSNRIPKVIDDPEKFELSEERKHQNQDEDEKQDNSYMDETGLTEFEADFHSGKVMDVRKFDAELEELDRGITICNKARNFIIYGVCLLGMIIVLYKLGTFMASKPKQELVSGESGEFIMDSFTIGYYLLEKLTAPISTSLKGLELFDTKQQRLFVECFSQEGVSGLNIFKIDETDNTLVQINTARMQQGDVGGSCSKFAKIEPNSFGIIQTVVDSKKIYNWTLVLQPNKPGASEPRLIITQTTRTLSSIQLGAVLQTSDNSSEHGFVGALANVKDGFVYLSHDLETVLESKPVRLLDKRQLGIKVVALTSVYSPSRLVLLPDHTTLPDQLLIVNANNGFIIKRVDISGLRSRVGHSVQEPTLTPLTTLTSDNTGALYLSGVGWPAVVKIRIAAKHFKLGH